MSRRLTTLNASVSRERAGLDRKAVGAVIAWSKALDAAVEALDARSPTRVLARGYALIQDEESGRLVRAPEHTSPGRVLTIRFSGGEIRARVESVPAPASGGDTDE